MLEQPIALVAAIRAIVSSWHGPAVTPAGMTISDGEMA